jgi:hypothetical protein
MEHKAEKAGEKPFVSKFEQKRRDRAAGKRPPFEFKECRAPHSNPPRRKRSSILATAPTSGTARATVIETRFQIGYAFIMTDEGQQLYLGLNVLEESHAKYDLCRGFTVECEFESSPGKRYPRVSRVISVMAPPYA